MSQPAESPAQISPLPALLALRLLARVIDASFLVVVGGSIGLFAGFGYGWLIATSLLVLVYFAAADSLMGTTIGKALAGLRVIGPRGDKPSFTEAMIRESFTLLGAIPFAGPILALAAWLWIYFTIRSSPTGQGGHDRFAGGTRVVRV